MTMGVYDYKRGDNMQLTYYNNKTDKRYINKNLETISMQDHANPVNIVLIDDTNIITPTFKMSDKDIYMTANYCYVDTLHRFYYIDDITLSDGFAYLRCSIDVLHTYRNLLYDQKVIVSRNEKDYNLYQVDNKQKILNYKAVRTVNFPSGFDENTQCFVMGVVGNTTGGNE